MSNFLGKNFDEINRSPEILFSSVLSTSSPKILLITSHQIQGVITPLCVASLNLEETVESQAKTVSTAQDVLLRL